MAHGVGGKMVRLRIIRRMRLSRIEKVSMSDRMGKVLDRINDLLFEWFEHNVIMTINILQRNYLKKKAKIKPEEED
jgi:hypothetical protein